MLTALLPRFFVDAPYHPFAFARSAAHALVGGGVDARAVGYCGLGRAGGA
jgi:hypothetical protein